MFAYVDDEYGNSACIADQPTDFFGFPSPTHRLTSPVHPFSAADSPSIITIHLLISVISLWSPPRLLISTRRPSLPPDSYLFTLPTSFTSFPHPLHLSHILHPHPPNVGPILSTCFPSRIGTAAATFLFRSSMVSAGSGIFPRLRRCRFRISYFNYCHMQFISIHT